MRTPEQIKNELDKINDFVLKGIPIEDIHSMIAHLSTMVSYLASTASLVTESGKRFQQAKLRAYHKLKTSSEAQREYYSPMLAKDYIAAQCNEEGSVYEYATRMNAAVTHGIDALRTAISAEKAMNQYSYTQT